MDSDSSPIVIIDRYTNPGRYWDVSSIITSLNYTYGRNQPFAVAEVVVKKSYFNSADMYWNGVSNVPKVNGIAVIPKIKSGTTPVTIILYGETYEFTIEKYNSDDDYITLLCYNKAYKLKNQIEFQSICKFKSEEGEYYFEGDDANLLSKEITEEGKIILSYEVDIVGNTPQVVKFHITDKSSAPVEGEVTGKGEITTNYIEATGTNIFKFIVNKALGISPAGCICDKGYSYYSFESEVEDTYTESEIEYVKGETPTASEEEQVLKLRVRDIDCWDIINSIGMLSNRWAFFHDKAYFVDYNSPQCNVYNDMQLDYGVNDEGEALSYYSYTDGESEIKNSLDIYQIVDNIDQGSKHVMSSQTVYSENHSATVRIVDAEREISGDDIYFPLIEDEFDNSIRNRITKELAFNRLVSNFRPLDCIEFTISEMVAPIQEFTHDADCVASRVTDLPTGKPNGTIGLVVDGIFSTYYTYDGIDNGWIVYESHKTSRNRRNELFLIYSKISTIRDIQNNITMEDVSLSRTQFSYPSCVTTLTFGNPEFSDALSQLSDLEKGVDTSTTKGTEDVLISDRYASKIVVGNQTLSALRDGREGFTGLIMEKNRDNELYRLSGYNEGILQAYFNSKGEIMSGNKKVIINSEGITIGAGGADIDSNITKIPIWNAIDNYIAGVQVIYDNELYFSLNDSNTNNTPSEGSDYWKLASLEDRSTKKWEPSTAYKKGIMVIYDKITYMAKSNIAGSDTFDSSKWEQLTDDDNVKSWKSTTAYKVGDLVFYEGIIYEAILDNINVSVSTSNTWTPQTDDENVKVWNIGASYKINDLVFHEGLIYRALKDNSGKPVLNTLYWTPLTDDKNIKVWEPSTNYAKDTRVFYDGVIYKAKDAIVGGDTFDVTKWNPIIDNTIIKSWEPIFYYKEGARVFYNGIIYRANSNFTTESEFSSANWVAEENKDIITVWVGKSYEINSRVLYNGLIYQSNKAEGTKTTFDDSEWDLISDDSNIKIWTPSTAYKINTLVYHDGAIYKAKSNLEGSSTFESSSWKMMLDDNNIKVWEGSTYYEKDTLAIYNGLIYKAIKDFTSTSSFVLSNWIQHTFDSRVKKWNNATSYSIGDMVLHNDTAYIATAVNTGVNPEGGIVFWAKFNDENSRISDWSADVTYGKGRLVRYNGVLFEAFKQNLNKKPNTTADTEFWKGKSDVLTFWGPFGTYNINDSVILGSKVYVALKVSKNIKPDTTADTGYWKHSIDTSNLAGAIIASINPVKGGNVVIDGEGLSTFNSNNIKQCGVDTSGNITGVKVEASNINAGSLKAGVIYTGDIIANQIQSGTMTADRISGGTIDATNVTVKNINASNINAGYVSVDDLATAPNYNGKTILDKMGLHTPRADYLKDGIKINSPDGSTFKWASHVFIPSTYMWYFYKLNGTIFSATPFYGNTTSKFDWAIEVGTLVNTDRTGVTIENITFETNFQAPPYVFYIPVNISKQSNGADDNTYLLVAPNQGGMFGVSTTGCSVAVERNITAVQWMAVGPAWG